MAWNGGGTFNRVYNWVSDALNSIPITASRMDGEFDNFKTGLENCITKDGQNAATANLPMGSNRHTGVGNAAARTDYAAAGQVQDNSMKYATDTGVADAYVVALTPAITAYVAGMEIIFLAAHANTGACTLAVNGLTAKSILLRDGGTPAAGAIPLGHIVRVVYNGTAFELDQLAATTYGDFSSNTSTSVDGQIVLFSGTGGKTGKQATTTGLLKAASGVLSAAVSGTDYAPATSGSSIIKGNGTGGFSSAAAGTDYCAATSGSGILKGSGGNTAAATAGTDYVAPGTNTTFTVAQRGSYTTLTDAATIAIDLSANNFFKVLLGGNRTLGVPTNIVQGQSGVITAYQDGTGSRTLVYSWCYQFPSGTAPTLSTGKYTKDSLAYSVDVYASSTVTITIATPGVVSWTAHGLYGGQRVQLTTTGALPTGLTASTSYYIIPVNADSFQLATSLVNAQAGTAIATSGSQSGTHTMTAAAITISQLPGVA